MFKLMGFGGLDVLNCCDLNHPGFYYVNEASQSHFRMIELEKKYSMTIWTLVGDPDSF
jgi:hypothetical protein